MQRRLTWCLFAAVAGAAIYASTSVATPSSNFTGSTLAKATFDEIDLNSHTLPANFWQAKVKTKGLSDLYVQSNAWGPGGTTGWHTHPGPSLIIVTAGTVTVYESDEPACEPHLYSQGMGFIDQGGDHVHLIRNEDTIVEARTIAVQLIPTAAVRRIDAAHPANCPASVN